MKKLIISSFSLLCLFLLLVMGTKVDGKPKGGTTKKVAAVNTLSVKFNGKPKNFKFRTQAISSNNGSLLTITGFTEDDSLSPSLFLTVEKESSKITPGTYYLNDDHYPHISAQYAIERAKDGAVVTNTLYETRDIGKKTDLIIKIISVSNGRLKGTFSGVITTEEDVTIAKTFTLTEGKFDVRLKSE